MEIFRNLSWAGSSKYWQKSLFKLLLMFLRQLRVYANIEKDALHNAIVSQFFVLRLKAGNSILSQFCTKRSCIKQQYVNDNYRSPRLMCARCNEFSAWFFIIKIKAAKVWDGFVFIRLEVCVVRANCGKVFFRSSTTRCNNDKWWQFHQPPHTMWRREDVQAEKSSRFKGLFSDVTRWWKYQIQFLPWLPIRFWWFPWYR